MKRNAGFTLIDITLLIGILGILLIVQLNASGATTQLGKFLESSRRTTCASNLKMLYHANYAYSNKYKGRFPLVAAIAQNNTGPVKGFDSKLERKAEAVVYKSDDLINNATAPLWMLIKDKSVKTKFYVCPSTKDVEDPMTLDGKKDGKPASLEGTADFFARENLSYSMINMYHPKAGRRWSTNAGADWVLMGDNNNADDGPDLHLNSKKTEKLSVQKVQENENSHNHLKEGQNFMFSDSSVSFSIDPFVGPNSDNVYAEDISANLGDDEVASPPTLSNSIPQPNPNRNIVLLPLSGNKGVSLDPEGEKKEIQKKKDAEKKPKTDKK